MTENEALEFLKRANRQYSMLVILPGSDIGKTLIKALEEVRQYRKIGTVRELKEAAKYLGLVKIHGTVGKAIEACAEYEGIGTVEECRAAMEKQRRKPVKNPYGTSYIWKAGYCPICGCGVTARWDYCQCCGQKLSWEDS